MSQSTARDLVLGVDASTTAVKCVVWDAEGSAVAEGRAGIELSNPEPLGYEQDAESWWSALSKACREVIEDVDPGRLAAMCIANQRETVVLTDAAGRPLRPALVWMDERCAGCVAQVRREHDPEWIHRESGKPVCTTPSLYKLLWVRQTEPHWWDRDFRVLDVHGFLVRHLTGRFRTSVASADPMGLVAMSRADWSDELLAIAGLGRSRLAELWPVGGRIGEVSAEAATQTGLPSGLPVIAGAGDGQAAGLGAGTARPDASQAYLNMGTALVSGVSSSHYPVDPAFRTLFGAAPETFFLETDLKGGTFTINWLLDKWYPEARDQAQRRALLERLDREAAGLPSGADGLVLVPYWCGVMNPYWDDDASGLIVGWRGHHGPAHLYRAILEGLAFEQRLQSEEVERAIGRTIEAFVVVGGGAANDLWCQIVADVTGRPVRRAGTTEATALGAGILAAVGGGVHRDLGAAVNAMTRFGKGFLPGKEQNVYERLYREVYAGLYPSVRGAMARLRRSSR